MKTQDPVKIELQGAEALRLLLGEVPAIESIDVHVVGQEPDAGIDLVADA
jgi:hypothetical protein